MDLTGLFGKKKQSTPDPFYTNKEYLEKKESTPEPRDLPQIKTSTVKLWPEGEAPKPTENTSTKKALVGWFLSTLELGVIIGLITWFWR